MLPSGAAPTRQAPFAPRPDAASLPVRGYPYCPFPLTARALPSPQPLFSPLSEPAHRALAAAVRELARTCPSPPRKGRRRRHRPLPAKNRNFLDLWQTIAQDLSRLFAVPGCCPPCSGSPKGWPGLCHRHELATGQGQTLRCFRRPRARAVSVARGLLAGSSRCLAGTRCRRRSGHTMQGAHGLPSGQPLHSTGGPERDGCPRRCDTVPWT